MKRIALLLVSVLVTLTACSSMDGTGSKGYITGDGQVQQVAYDDREDPIDLTGTSVDGDPLDLADYRGKPVVVVVWGAWCPPCRAEAPDLVEVASELGDRAQFVGISLRTGTAKAQSFEREFDVPYPSFDSQTGRELLAFGGTLGPRTIPATLVLDGEGRIAANIIGSIPSALTLQQVVEDVIDSDAGLVDG
jgi:thiol-disulfide isomerase/thioredoxin